MTAEALIDTLHEAGIRLAVSGDRLHVEAPPGRYNADLRARLLEHKADVVKLITMRDRLLAIARTIGLPADIVNRLPASELRACIDQLPLWAGQFDEQGEPLQARVLLFYLRALAGMEPAVDGSPAALRRNARHPLGCDLQPNLECEPARTRASERASRERRGAGPQTGAAGATVRRLPVRPTENGDPNDLCHPLPGRA